MTTRRASWLGFARSLAGRGVAVLMTATVFTLMARQLGAVELGVFLSMWTLAQAASLVGRRGVDIALLRLLSEASEERERRSLHRCGERLVLRRSMIVSFPLSAGCVVAALARPASGDTIWVGAALFASVPALACLQVGAEAAKARGAFVRAQLIQGCGITFLVALQWAGLLGLDPAWVRPSALDVAVLHALAAAGAWATVRARGGRAQSTRNVAHLVREAGPLLHVTLARFAYPWVPLWILAACATGAESGAYSAVARIALLLEIPLAALTAQLASSLAAADSESAARRVFQRGRLHPLVLASPLCAGLLAVPELPLSLLNITHEGASLALRILVVGQIVNLACGPVGAYLLMRDRGPELRTGVLGGLCVVVVVCAMLIPAMGLLGAAWAAAAGLTVQNLLALRSATTPNRNAPPWRIRQPLEHVENSR